LLLFSVISAIVATLSRSSIQDRFGLAFLGLFSSLAVYLNEKTAVGLLLLFTSCILIPYPASELASKERKRRNLSFSLQLSVLTVYAVCALAISAFARLSSIQAGLAIVASVGLGAFTLRGHCFLDPHGWVPVSQAILVAASLTNAPIWAIVCSELCRLGCITCGWFCKKRS